MPEYRITVKQLNELQEISSDTEAAERTLEIALNYHQNMIACLRKNKREWWEELGRIHGFDPNKEEWTVERSTGIICIKLKEDE